MKKLLVLLVAVIGFGFSANAQTATITRTTLEKDGIRVYFNVLDIYQDGSYNTGKYAGKMIGIINVKICAYSHYVTRLIATTCDYQDYVPPVSPSYARSENFILFTCDTSKLDRCGIADFRIFINNVDVITQ
jgi:hypothetical protein